MNLRSENIEPRTNADKRRPAPDSPESLLTRFQQGDRRACGQIISLVEDGDGNAEELLHQLYPRTGRAYRIGVTGPPGAGKSTLVEKLAAECRKQRFGVGIVAVDPTSPFSGGAILGDRVRMSSLFLDTGVFIRSMGSRGSLGGMALKTKEVCDVLDAFGSDVILIETIGVGQVELDIAGAAHTTVVVLVPESGDSIQAMKAGLMEVGDLFAVNKSDRDGADRLAMEIEAVLEMRTARVQASGGSESGESEWKPLVVKTVAVQGIGTTELLNRIWDHRAWLTETSNLERHNFENARREITELVQQRLREQLWSDERVQAALSDWLPRVAGRAATPYEAAERILRTYGNTH